MGAYQNSIFLVDAGARGILDRKTKKETDYYLHPLARSEWGTVDNFRGAQGYYTAKSSQDGGDNLINYSLHPYWSKQIYRPLKLAGDHRFTNSSFTVYFDNENWNEAIKANKAKLRNYLAKPATKAISGDPNFYHYLAGNLGQTSYYKKYYLRERKQRLAVLPLLEMASEFTDHVTLYRMPPTDASALERSNYNVAVNSFYNFYLDTMPPYEAVVESAGRGSELLLPNLYMLESDMINTASVNYTDQLTLNKAGEFYDGPELDVWFLDQTQTSPESGKAYYQQFSEAMDAVVQSGDITSIKEDFESRFKNIAILYPDLDILKKYNVRDDRGTPNDTSDDLKSTAFYPFYNEVIIGFDRDDVFGIGAKPAAHSFFTSLFASKLNADHVRSFIVFMQLYIMENMRSGAVESTSYDGLVTQATGVNGDTKSEFVSMAQDSEVVCDLDLFLEALRNRELDYLLDVYNESKEELADGSNYTLLREWEKEELFKLNVKDAIKVANSQELEDALEDRRRSLKEVFENQEAPGETLMYLIEKREVRTDRDSPGEVLQTIMVSKDVVHRDLIRYLDTQVRYGVRYEYRVKQVRMIFGNSYTYDGVNFDFGAKKIGEGRALGNALGFYNLTKDVLGAPITVNGLDPSQEYEYLSPGQEQKPATVQHGHFVFKLPAPMSQMLRVKNQLPANRASAPNSPLGKYYQAIRAGKADLSGLIVHLHAGFGTDGSLDGGMTGYNIEIPVTEDSLSPTMAPGFEAEAEESQSPVTLYRQAIDILVGESPGGQAALDSTINQIVNNFENILESGDRARANGLLAELRRVRERARSVAPGTTLGSSVATTDSRSLAARSIYNTVDTQVREMLDSVVAEPRETDATNLMNPLLKEVLGPPTPQEQSSTATNFAGPKGATGLNMRFGK